MPTTVQQIISNDAARLATALGLDAASARLEVQYLLQHVLEKPRAWLLAHPEAVPEPQRQQTYTALLARRLAGEPIAYILGAREFYGLNFKVTRATLIPRPETELLVELALQRIPPDLNCGVLDLGAGSGAIALAIAHARPRTEMVAVDASPAALEVARENAVRLNIRNARFVHSDWYEALGEMRFNVIVSNPPYVAAGDPHLAQGDLRFEPPSALASGVDGLDDIRRIAAGACAHLEPGGWLLLEHGYDQGAAVQGILRAAGLREVFTAPDLSGIGRVSGGRLAPA
jgi:release factor glutamine methyltransferase